MTDSYTEVTNKSWGSRMKNAFGGIGTGILLIIAATYLMYWNEGRSVRTGDAITEAQLAAEELPSISSVDASFNGKLVHAVGGTATTDELTDPMFGIKVNNAVKLRRKVEYYQWIEESKQETRTKLGGGQETVTTYTYRMDWVSNPVNSQSFKQAAGHENTVRIQAKSEEQYAKNVTFGAYRLPDFFIRSISGEQAVPINLTDDERSELQRVFFSQNPLDTVDNTGNSNLEENINNSGSQAVRGPNTMINVQGNFLYIGRRPNQPKVGDMRISFFEVPAQEISIIAKVSGDTFAPFRASNGENFSKLSMGNQEMSVMFDQAHSANSTMTWVLRIVGILLCIAGIRTVLAPLRVIADVIPILGSIVGAGTGLVAGLLGVAWSLVVIAFAWIRFRPVLGISLLAIAFVLVVLLFLKGRRKSAAQAA